MTRAIDHLEELHNNPFIFSPLFPVFYKALGEKPHNSLLAYLLLPLVLYQESNTFLKNANSRSSMRTMVDKPSRLFGLQQRIVEYREITNLSIQHAIDNGALLSSERASYKSGETKLPTILTEMSRPASKLGLLFAPFDVPSIFRTVGVKSL
jgi:hypothetical protein